MSLEIFGFDIFSFAGLYIFSIVFLCFWLYSYIFYLYRAKKTRGMDYEKYSNLALKDSLNDTPVESMDIDNTKEGDNNGLAK